MSQRLFVIPECLLTHFMEPDLNDFVIKIADMKRTPASFHVYQCQFNYDPSPYMGQIVFFRSVTAEYNTI